MQKSRLLNRLIRRAADFAKAHARADLPLPNIVTQKMNTTPSFDPSVRPIFIVGAPRSGTSITNWALGQHPNIQPMPETAWIAAMAVGVQNAYVVGSERGRYSHLSNVALPPETFFRRFGEAIDTIVCDVFEERCTRLHGDWRKLSEIKNPESHPNPQMLLRRQSSDPKRRWIDATPMNSAYIYGLAMMFPDAKFIHLIREPHEVVTSLVNFEVVGGQAHEISEAIRNWMDHTYAAYAAQKAFGSKRIALARFDAMSKDSRKFFEELLSFLDEEWCEDCLAPLQKKINSSQVDNKRDQVQASIAGNASYVAAKALYNEIISRPRECAPEPSALDELKRNFEQTAARKRPI